MRYAFTLGSRTEGLYRVNGREIRALVHDNNHQSELWHRKFAYLHCEALPKVRRMVFGMLEFQANHDGVCQGRASGKKLKRPFASSRSKISDILQLIHSDLCGPMPVKSLGGYLYDITFVDDFSRKTWIFFLKHKNKAFVMFKDLKALIENQIEKRIKVFRFDNGGEFILNKFIDFCKKAGIKKETIVPYNPQQNGVDERKNKTIMEAA